MPAQALAKVKCHQTVSFAKLDPIVYHAQTGTSHLHQFYGNTSWLSKGNWANYGDLAGGTTNCRDKADTAGYWTPALLDATGKPVAVQAFTAYYRPFMGVGKFGPAMAYPPDTRLVATDDTRGGWSCGINSGARSALKQAIPDCSGLSGGPGNTLTAHVVFPSCWNGKLPNHTAGEVGNTSDNADYTYPKRVSAGVYACPVAFPKQMVSLNETIQYNYTGKGTDLTLSSDHHAGTNDGQSMHADFWNAWNQPALTSMVRNCVVLQANHTDGQCAI